MGRAQMVPTGVNLFLLLLPLIFLSPSLCSPAASTRSLTKSSTAQSRSPFTPRASLLRYWSNHISTSKPPPSFLLSKSSLLDATVSAYLTKLLSTTSTAQINSSFSSTSFCSIANLCCSFEPPSTPQSSDKVRSSSPANFALYSNKRFSKYGASQLGGIDSFKNYSSTGLNAVTDSFLKYSKESTSHNEAFTTYSKDANVANTSFGNYGFGATGGTGKFTDYHAKVNVPGLQFTTYDSDGNNHELSFSSYSPETNSGEEKFTSYGKRGNGVPSGFVSYSEDSNIIESGFTGYGELGNGGNDSFKGYGRLGNDPRLNFRGYGTGGNAGVENFMSYRVGANEGRDMFVSYARAASSGSVNFREYGKSFNPVKDTFIEYGKGSRGNTTVGFKNYGEDRSFKGYMEKGVSFGGYGNASSENDRDINVLNKRWVEPGRFFRESMLKEGNVMVMPDIRDRMPERSFLPRSIVSKLPFSTLRLSEVRETFGAAENSATERVLVNALAECERAPSQGETKRCVGSIEDMIDFAVLVLGRNVVVRTTESVNGSTENVMIGRVIGIDGGKVTKSVSCHQSLYPYLLYYCHSVPKVRVYEADILDVESKSKINHGIAICHLDTSAWSPEHGAFVALGSKPGSIEVCHWIFENDMTWTVAD